MRDNSASHSLSPVNVHTSVLLLECGSKKIKLQVRAQLLWQRWEQGWQRLLQINGLYGLRNQAGDQHCDSLPTTSWIRPDYLAWLQFINLQLSAAACMPNIASQDEEKCKLADYRRELMLRSWKAGRELEEVMTNLVTSDVTMQPPWLQPHTGTVRGSCCESPNKKWLRWLNTVEDYRQYLAKLLLVLGYTVFLPLPSPGSTQVRVCKLLHIGFQNTISNKPGI